LSTKNNIEIFIKEILKNYKLLDLNFDDLYKLMLNDKKNDNSEINFILLKNYSKTIEQKVPKEILEKSFKEFISLF
jgi:3-dehydroquinate synthase